MKRLLVLGSLIFLIVALVLTGCVGKKINNPPTIVDKSLSATEITVGESVDLYYKVSDPDGDPVTVTVDWGDGQSENFTEVERTVSHTYNEAGEYTVQISVSDGKGGQAGPVTVGTVVVSAPVPPNTPPKITDFYVEEGNFFENDLIPATLVVNDPDANESLTVKIFWSTTPTGFGYESAEFTGKTPGTIRVDFQISKAGHYYIWAEVIDSKGASDTTRNYPQFADYERDIYVNHVPGITLTVAPNQGNAGDTNFVVTATVDYKGDDIVRDDITSVEIDLVYPCSDADKKLEWNPTPDDTSQSWNVNYYWIDEDGFYVTATVTDDAGNKATAQALVKVLNRDPSIDIVATPAVLYRGDKVKFDLHVSDPDVGKAQNENVIYTYEVKVDGTSWDSDTKSLASASVIDKHEPVADTLGTYSIVATVTDNFGGEDSDSETIVATVINHEPVIEGVETEDTYYEDETFVATVNVVDADVDNGYDTLAGTFTLISGTKKVEGNIVFNGTVGTISVDGANIDPVVYDLYVKVWDTPGGDEAETSVMDIQVISRLYANVTLWYEWYDGEEEETVGPYGTKQNHSVVAMDPIYLRFGSDNFDEPATLVVRIDDTNIRTPRKVKLEWRLDGGNVRDFYDDDADGDGLYTIAVDYVDFFLGKYAGASHTVTGDVYVVSADDESDRVKVATVEIHFVEGNDPEVSFVVSTPTSTSPAPVPMVTGAGEETPSGTCSEEAIIEYGATLTINDESLYEYTVTVEKNGAVVGTRAGTNTGGNVTSLYYRNDLYDLGLALDFYECAAEFTVTVAATDFPDNNNWPYGSNYVTSWTFTMADQASPLTEVWLESNDPLNYVDLAALPSIPYGGKLFKGYTTAAYFTNTMDTIWFKGKLFDYHLATGTLFATDLESPHGVGDEIFDNNSEAAKAPWERDWVQGQFNESGIPEGIYKLELDATDLCGHAASDATYLVVDRTAPTVLATVVATCTESDASGTVDFDIDATDNWLLDDHDTFNASSLTYSIDFYYVESGYDANDVLLGSTVTTDDHNLPAGDIGTADDSLDYAGYLTVATTIEYEGTITVAYEIYDMAGNKGQATATVCIDRAAPRINLTDLSTAVAVGNDIQFNEDSTITALATWTVEDFCSKVATVSAVITTDSSIIFTHDIAAGAFYSPVVSSTDITATITLLGGNYYPTDSIVGTITVVASDECASNTGDSDIAAWHTRVATYLVTIDNLVWTNSDFIAFLLDDNDLDGTVPNASPDCLYVTVGRSSDGATVTYNPNASITVWSEDGYTLVAEASEISINAVGDTWITYEVVLKSVSSNNVREGNTYTIKILQGAFAIQYDDANFWNGYYTTQVQAIEHAPQK